MFMYVYVFFYIYVVAFQLFSDTVLGPNACCEQPPGVPHPPMYQYRPRVYISNTLCAKKWATDPNITWKSNMHPLPKNLTLKSLNQMKEREREKSKNPTKHSTYQSQSSMDVLRKVPGNATAPETVAAPRKPPRPLQRWRLRGESRRRRRRPEVGGSCFGVQDEG
jgi:hypothetical protein